MICTFCGTENPLENRFCGICGVRLERRKLERRTRQRGETTCVKCGHVNEAPYKYCGMCGAGIDQRVRERRGDDGAARASSLANVQLPAPVMAGANRQAATATATLPPENEQRRSDSVSRTQQEVSSGVSGPSFLGLNEPDAGAEYLLEDERSPHRGLRAFLLLVVLAAIVGLIFVQYRSSQKANPKSPSLPNPGPATVPRSEGKNRPPGQEKPVQTAIAARNLESGVSAVAAAADSPIADAALVTNNVTNKKSAVENDPPDDPVADQKADPPAAKDDQPSPALAKAQQYLHGRGVRQNCEQGLIYLRAAARENDPEAAVQMGALYSSGVCVAQNRVKAYEWFSSAQELQPDNHWITKNMNELWARMTQQERQQIHQ